MAELKKDSIKKKTTTPLKRVHKGKAAGNGQGKPNQTKESFTLKRRKGLKLYVAGKSLNDIAVALGVSYETVANWKEKYAWNDVLELAEMEFNNRVAVQSAKRSVEDAGTMAEVATTLINQAEAVPLDPLDKIAAYKEGRQWAITIKTLDGTLTATQAESLKEGNTITQILANAARRADKLEGEKK